MKHFLVILSIILSFTGKSNAQQDPLYSQYLLNPAVINPAYTGLHDRFVGTINTRFQWTAIEGAPKTLTAIASSSFFNNKVGVGVMFVRDEMGASNNNEFYTTYGYKIEAFDGNISFGLQAGVINYQYNYSDLTVKYIDDPAFPVGQEGDSKPNFGGGIIYSSDKLFLGVSVPRILNTEFNDGVVSSTRYHRHFYGYGAYLLDLGLMLKLKPAILVKAVSGAPVSTDVNFNVIYSSRYSAGIFTRNFNSYGFLLQLDITDGLHFGYTYELYDTPVITNATFNTHEIMLRVDIALLPNHTVFKTYF